LQVPVEGQPSRTRTGFERGMQGLGNLDGSELALVGLAKPGLALAALLAAAGLAVVSHGGHP